MITSAKYNVYFTSVAFTVCETKLSQVKVFGNGTQSSYGHTAKIALQAKQKYYCCT